MDFWLFSALTSLFLEAQTLEMEEALGERI
jgi:hypothetical protein